MREVNVKPHFVTLMVNWKIEDMKVLSDKMKKSIEQYDHWEERIKKFGKAKNGTLPQFQELLSEGAKYDTTRTFQELRQTVEEAQKAHLLVAEVFDAKARPCLSMADLKSFCEKIKQFPFKLEKTELLVEELNKAKLVLG
jgi:hypothetical protein